MSVMRFGGTNYLLIADRYMTDFVEKNSLLKELGPVGTSYLDTVCFSIVSKLDTIKGQGPKTARLVFLPVKLNFLIISLL